MRHRLAPPAWLTDSTLLLETFVTINLAFLALDIYVAHSMNEFRHWGEWIPFYFSIAGALAMMAVIAGAAHQGFHTRRRLLRRRAEDGEGQRDGGLGDDGPEGAAVRASCAVIATGPGRWTGFIIGWGSIIVGIAGLLWHLQSNFFHAATLKNLVYSAPFIAPLAYTGVGLLLLTNRLLTHQSRSWARWVLFLSWGGWLGNFGLSLLDHAQNGFYFWTEWIPVATSALAVGFILVLVLTSRPERILLRVTAWILLLQVITGVLGLGLHLRPLLDFSTAPLFDRIVHGAPVFAPLLFVNLALLAGIGVWALWQEEPAGLRLHPGESPPQHLIHAGAQGEPE